MVAGLEDLGGRPRFFGCWWLVELGEGKVSVGGLGSRARFVGFFLGWYLEVVDLCFFDGGLAPA